MRDVHTEHNQDRGGSEGKVTKELEKRECVLSLGHIKGGAHDFKSDPELRNAVDQTA
jgi:hypothetical protein